MECKICNRLVVNIGVGSPLYCSDCNAQIALAAERLMKNNTRKRPLAAGAGRIEF